MITLTLSSTLYIQYIFSSHKPGGFLFFLLRELISQSDCELIKVFQKLQASLYIFFVIYRLADTEIRINEMVERLIIDNCLFTVYRGRVIHRKRMCYRGFVRQPCYVAGAIDSFSYGKKYSFSCKTFSSFLPLNMAAVQNLY